VASDHKETANILCIYRDLISDLYGGGILEGSENPHIPKLQIAVRTLNLLRRICLYMSHMDVSVS